MKPIWILIFLTFGLSSLSAQQLTQLRDLLDECRKDESKILQLKKTTDKFWIYSTPLKLGYLALSEFLKCSHCSNPILKIKYFKNGKSLLESAINKEPENAELRYFRYCTQKNAPAMLGYSDELMSDKAFLLNFITTSKTDSNADDVDLQRRIKIILNVK